MADRNALFDAHSIEHLQKHFDALVQTPVTLNAGTFPMSWHIHQQEPVIMKIRRDPIPERAVEKHPVEENHRRPIASPALMDANGTQNRFDEGFPVRHY